MNKIANKIIIDPIISNDIFTTCSEYYIKILFVTLYLKSIIEKSLHDLLKILLGQVAIYLNREILYIFDIWVLILFSGFVRIFQMFL